MSVQEKYQFVTERDYCAIADEMWPSYSDFVKHVDIEQWVYQEIDKKLQPPEEFTHPSFCVNPFYSYEWPGKVHCCLLPNDHDINKIRREMLNGVRPDECIKCWSLEDCNIESDRILKNKSLDFWANRDLKKLYQDCVDQNFETMHYKIDTSNRCNATCVTCDGNSSSSWNLLDAKHDIITTSNWNIEKSEIDKKLNYKTAKMIAFRGGEPLLSNTNFEILESLLRSDNADCYISFVTNGSVKPTARQIQILKQFSNINFCFSVDSIGKKFEYIRYPLKWSNVEKNIKWAQDQKFDVSVSYTVSNLNIMHHHETIQWFKSNNIPFLVNLVYRPQYFSPWVLPDEIKTQIKDSEFINNNHEFDMQLWHQFKQEIHRQDMLKNTVIGDYLPELAEIIKKY